MNLPHTKRPYSLTTPLIYILDNTACFSLKWPVTALATTFWQGENKINTYDQLVTLFQWVSDHSMDGNEVGERLLTLWQGHWRVAEYTLDFRTLAAESRWNGIALRSVYILGLTEDILKELACRDESASLDMLMHLSIKLDNLMRERFNRDVRGESPSCALLKNMPRSSEPMDSSSSRIRPDERERQRDWDLVIICCTSYIIEGANTIHWSSVYTFSDDGLRLRWKLHWPQYSMQTTLTTTLAQQPTMSLHHRWST